MLEEIETPETTATGQGEGPEPEAASRPRRAASRPAGPPPTVTNPFSHTGPAVPAPPPAPPQPAQAAAAPAAIAVFRKPELPAVRSAPEPEEESDDGSAQPARRRSRNRKGKSGGAEAKSAAALEESSDQPIDSGAEPASETPQSADDTAGDADDDTSGGSTGGGSSTKRRRRRRRGSGGDGGDGESESDDPNTVTKVRAPKESEQSQRVTGVKGSTRLEAKKQRRREGREAGRRRAPILSEAEFLARREAVERSMVVRQREDVTQIAVLEDGVLAEHYVTKESGASPSIVGNVYLGRVQNVLPSMEAAFVDIGRGRNAVLYAGEVNWDAAGLDGQPKRIEFALKSGDPVLVQVTKDPIGHKGARLTSQISLPGRYLVFVPDGSMTGISRKLPDTERSRLRTVLKRIVPDDVGVIVRTAAEGASDDELERDVTRLANTWQEIQRKAKAASPPQRLHAEPDLAIRVVRDIFNEDFASVEVSGDKAWKQVKQYVDSVAPDLADRVSKWTGTDDVFAHYRIDEQLAKALDRKVWLPSGGSLIIEHTEAMTVIDVNTGKFTGQGGDLEETVTENNLEAAEEIVRQVRLRDIGGIIVIDFIDMVLESNRDLVLRRLVECLGRDRTKHQVTEITSLGLAQMTRKRIGGGLLETFSESCDACNGRGVRIHFDHAGAPVNGRRKPVKPSGAHDPVEIMMKAQDDPAEESHSEPDAEAEHGPGEPVAEEAGDSAAQEGQAAQAEPEVAVVGPVTPASGEPGPAGSPANDLLGAESVPGAARSAAAQAGEMGPDRAPAAGLQTGEAASDQAPAAEPQDTDSSAVQGAPGEAGSQAEAATAVDPGPSGSVQADTAAEAPGEEWASAGAADARTRPGDQQSGDARDVRQTADDHGARHDPHDVEHDPGGAPSDRVRSEVGLASDEDSAQVSDPV